jgi:threonine dehydrogenase-like Zn-dependent dehydrogenase
LGYGRLRPGEIDLGWCQILGATRIIGIDYVPQRLKVARQRLRIETINDKEYETTKKLHEMVPGGVDCSLQPCFFNKSSSYENNYSFNSTSDADVLNEIMTCTKKGGTISIIAHHNGFNYISMEKHTSIIIGQSDTQKH